MLKIYAWYVIAIVSLIFPPLLIVTGIPLAYCLYRAWKGIKQARVLGVILAEQEARKQQYRDAQAVRKALG